MKEKKKKGGKCVFLLGRNRLLSSNTRAKTGTLTQHAVNAIGLKKKILFWGSKYRHLEEGLLQRISELGYGYPDSQGDYLPGRNGKRIGRY